MPSRVGEHIQRLIHVVSPLVQHGCAEFFGTPPLTLQFLDGGHAKVVMHLLRHIVRGPGWPSERRNLLESEHAVSCPVDQDEPVRVIVATVGGDLVARAVTKTKKLPVELRQIAAVSGVESSVHQNGIGGNLSLLLLGLVTAI